jgi:hypothetical protein
MPLRGGFDAVAFISEPDSMISPSEGVDGDLERLRDAMVTDRHVVEDEYHHPIVS